MLLHFSDRWFFCNTISNPDDSALVVSHTDPFVLSFRRFCDRLKRARRHDAQLSEVQKLALSDYILASANHLMFCVCLAALWMVEVITYSLHYYNYKNYLKKYILGRERPSGLIIWCDPSTFKKTHIRQSMVFPTLRPVVNSVKEVGSSGLEIARHCVSFL